MTCREDNRQLDKEQRKTEDLNAQKDTEGSGNPCGTQLTQMIMMSQGKVKLNTLNMETPELSK